MHTFLDYQKLHGSGRNDRNYPVDDFSI